MRGVTMVLMFCAMTGAIDLLSYSSSAVATEEQLWDMSRVQTFQIYRVQWLWNYLLVPPQQSWAIDFVCDMPHVSMYSSYDAKGNWKIHPYTSWTKTITKYFDSEIAAQAYIQELRQSTSDILAPQTNIPPLQTNNLQLLKDNL